MTQMIDDFFDYFYAKGFGPMFDGTPVPAAVLSAYRGKLPDQLLTYWRTQGWGGYGDGLLWLVDPREYAEALHPWLHGTNLDGKDRYHVVARTAFGKLYIWGEKSGFSVKVSAPWSMIFPTDESADVSSGKADLLVRSWISSFRKADLDQTDINEEPLFDRAVKLLGRPGPDEMFGFVPALALGGPCRLDHLQKVKAVEHLMFLAQVQPPRVMLDIVQEAKKRGLM